MSFDRIPPRRGPEPLCFQPLAPGEHPDDHSPLFDHVAGLFAIGFAAWVAIVLLAAWLAGGR